MKSSRTGHSTASRPRSKPSGADRSPAANGHVERERVIVARAEWVRRREQALELREAALRGREAAAQSHAEVDRLMGRLREANERLIVTAVDAQNRSDEARADAMRSRIELDDLLNHLRDANERLSAAAAQAHTMAEEAEHRQEEYRELSNRLLTLQDEERRRLALDLHDSTAQCLAAMTMNLDMVDYASEALDARSRRALAESRSLAQECFREVRTLAYVLHPPLLDDVGLLSAVRWFVEGFSKRSGIDVTMEMDDIGRLPAPIETALYRVVQESLTNVYRHASTTTASIRLTATAHEVALEIQDQGHGLVDDRAHPDGTLVREALGVGIQGMRERVCQLGGTFAIEFTDAGTTVRARMPLDPQSA